MSGCAGRSRNYATTGGARPRMRRSRAALVPIHERCERSRGDRGEEGEARRGRAAAREPAWARPAARARARRPRRRRAPAARASRRRARSPRRAARPSPPGRRRRPRSRPWRPPTGGRGRAMSRRAARRAAPARRRRARARRCRAPAYQPWPAASRQLCAPGSHSTVARVWSVRTASSGSSTRARRVSGMRRIDSHSASADERRIKIRNSRRISMSPRRSRAKRSSAALERLAQRAADEEGVGDRREDVGALELVLELERRPRPRPSRARRRRAGSRAASRPRPRASGRRAPRRR